MATGSERFHLLQVAPLLSSALPPAPAAGPTRPTCPPVRAACDLPPHPTPLPTSTHTHTHDLPTCPCPLPQVFGFIVMITGTTTYNETVRMPCIRYPDAAERAAEEEKRAVRTVCAPHPLRNPAPHPTSHTPNHPSARSAPQTTLAAGGRQPRAAAIADGHLTTVAELQRRPLLSAVAEAHSHDDPAQVMRTLNGHCCGPCAVRGRSSRGARPSGAKPSYRAH